MNEFNIIKYLNDVNLKDIITFIKLPNQKERILEEYLFQAKNDDNEIITGHIYILNNEINISYRSKTNTIHSFASKIIFYTSSEYIVITKHSVISPKNEEIVLDRKVGHNIDKRNIFSFKENKKNKKNKNKVLVKY